MDNKGLYPEIINNFHLYKGAENGGDMMLGISGQVELPDLEAITETLSGSGILGEVEVTNPGHYSALDVTIPYVAVCEGMFSNNPTKRVMLTLRACEQSTVKATVLSACLAVRSKAISSGSWRMANRWNRA